MPFASRPFWAVKALLHSAAIHITFFMKFASRDTTQVDDGAYEPVASANPCDAGSAVDGWRPVQEGREGPGRRRRNCPHRRSAVGLWRYQAKRRFAVRGVETRVDPRYRFRLLRRLECGRCRPARG